MKFLFFPGACTKFYANTLEEKPLGGTETAIIRLTEQLALLGHDVTVLTSERGKETQNPFYLHVENFDYSLEFDVLIVIREWVHLLKPFKVRKKFYWTSDSYRSFSNVGIGDRRFIQYADGVFVVSEWHRDTLSQASGFPLFKMWILDNAIHHPYFAAAIQKSKRLIYSSAPNRGLIHMLKIFPALKKKHPDLEFHIFSSFDRYYVDLNNEMLEKREDFLQEFRKIDGCYVHSSLPQKELALELLKSSLLTYPCHFEETSCITAMEAMAAGCPIVTSKLAALPETIQDAGVFIDGVPGSNSYLEKFIEAVDHLLTNRMFFETLAQKAKNRALNFTWEKTAENLLQYLKIFHQLS